MPGRRMETSKGRKFSVSMRCATPVSSSTEIVDTTAEPSITSRNWLARAGKTAGSAGKTITWRAMPGTGKPRPGGPPLWPPGNAQRISRLDLAARNGVDACAPDLGCIRAAVDGHADQRRIDRIEPQAQRRKPEPDEKQLNQ